MFAEKGKTRPKVVFYTICSKSVVRFIKVGMSVVCVGMTRVSDHVGNFNYSCNTFKFHLEHKMSGATPTLIPREPIFPRLLPKAPQPHPMPLPRKRVYGHLNAFRDLQREMDDLSDEENDLEDLASLSD
jgi:hypothetical protein